MSHETAVSDDIREVCVGLVAYLNVQPLVWAFDHGLVAPTSADGRPLRFESAVPSALAARLRTGQVHVGIVPVFEYFATPGYTIVPAGAIATRRRVGSVLLVANAPLERLRRVTLDPASLTSANLLRVLHAERRWGFDLVEGGRTHEPARAADWLFDTPEPAGQLLIGDPALAAIGRFPFIYDLGTLWYELTGLPFVFATWLVHPLAQRVPLLEPLRRAREIGTAHLAEVAAERGPRFGFPPDFTLRYFSENLWFELGEDEMAGIREYGRLLHRHGLVPETRPLRLQE